MTSADAPHDRAHGARALRVLVALYAVAALVATILPLARGGQINNFLIFRNSFLHLLHDQNLYASYPADALDLFKYSPTAALFFAPFAVLPIAVGLTAWNLVNAMSLVRGVSRLLPPQAAAWALGIAFFEALGSIQNAQSNAVVAALMIGAVLAVEHQQAVRGAVAIALGASFKIFPLATGIFGLMTPNRWRHVAWCSVAGVTALLLPLLVTSPSVLLAQYRWWGDINAHDHLFQNGMWLGGVIEIVLGHAIAHTPVQAFGAFTIVLTCWLARHQWNDAAVRRLLTASVLTFATVFNHKAESPSYVIAFTGIGIWWASLPRERWRDVLVVLVVVIGSLGGSDLAPRSFRADYYRGWQLKAVAASASWFAMQFDLVRWLRRAPGAAVARASHGVLKHQTPQPIG
jgi:hypothetical protein